MQSRDECLHSLALAVRALRLGRQAEAAERVIAMVDALSRHLSLQAVDRIDDLGEILADVVAAQERGDPLRVADLLEYEIGPRI